MLKVSSTVIVITGMFFLFVDQGYAQDGEKEVLKATMTIISDDAQVSAQANRILLPPSMQARVQERIENQKRKSNAPTIIMPANNQINGGVPNGNPFIMKSEPSIFNLLPERDKK